MDVKQIRIGNTNYTLKDIVARGGTVDGAEVTSIVIDGVAYDCKDAVARGEMEPTANEVCKLVIGGKDYYIKDETARAKVEYFAVYSSDDDSLTFYGDKTVPSEGERYNGKTVTAVYTGVENTGTRGNPPWYSNRTAFKSVVFDSSFADARPISCYRWFQDFSNCTAIDGLEYFDTSSVTTMERMFYQCTALTTLDVSGFNTSNVTTMYGMFLGCSSLTTLDVSGFNTQNVTDMSNMFLGCSSLTTLDVSGFNTQNVTDMSSMFNGCASLTTLDVSNFDTSRVTNMGYMFAYCDLLTTIYSDDANFVITAVTNGTQMFYNCTKLVGGNGTKYSTSNVTHTMAHIDTEDNPGYFTGK